MLARGDKPERPKLSGQMPARIAAKWREDLLDEGFVPVAKRLIRCLPSVFRGSHALEQLAVVLSIIDYRRPGMTRAPSAGLLGFTAGMSPEDFMARLKELQTQGLIRVGGTPQALEIDLEGFYTAVRERSDEA